MNQDQSPSDNKGGMNMLLFVVQTWAFSLEVFLHRDIGHRYVGIKGIAVLVLIPVYCLFWERYNLSGMLMFSILFFVFCAITNWSHRLRRNQLGRGHSRYTGWPRLLRSDAYANETKFKQFREPLFVSVSGLVISIVDQPLGWYLILGSLSLFISVSITLMIDHERAIDLNDGMIEQYQLSERFQNIRGGHYD